MVLKRYKVKKYLTTQALIVRKEYRGVGIGEHLLRANEGVCIEYGIPLTASIFTTDASNALANKLGYTLDITFR